MNLTLVKLVLLCPSFLLTLGCAPILLPDIRSEDPFEEKIDSLSSQTKITATDIRKSFGEPIISLDAWNLEVYKNTGRVTDVMLLPFPFAGTSDADYFLMVVYDATKHVTDYGIAHVHYNSVPVPDRDYHVSVSGYDFIAYNENRIEILSPIDASESVIDASATLNECLIFILPEKHIPFALDNYVLNDFWPASLNEGIIRWSVTPGTHNLYYWVDEEKHLVQHTFDCSGGDSFYLELNCQGWINKHDCELASTNQLPENVPRSSIRILLYPTQKDSSWEKLYLDKIRANKKPWWTDWYLCPKSGMAYPYAQAGIGKMYRRGIQGYSQNLVKAYLWYSLALKGYPESSEWKQELVSIMREMTPDEISEAQRIFTHWLPKQCSSHL